MEAVTWLATVGLYRKNTLLMFMFGKIKRESCHLYVCVAMRVWGRLAVFWN